MTAVDWFHHPNTLVLFEAIDIMEKEAMEELAAAAASSVTTELETDDEEEEDPENIPPEEKEQPTPFPFSYTSYNGPNNDYSYAFVCVKTGISKCKQVDLDFIGRLVGVCPKECVAGFIAKPGFKVNDATDEGCVFKAINASPGCFYTFKKPTSSRRVRTCHYHPEGASEQLAGVCVYPAFHNETDSLLEHEGLIESLLKKDSQLQLAIRQPPAPQLLVDHNKLEWGRLLGSLAQQYYYTRFKPNPYINVPFQGRLELAPPPAASNENLPPSNNPSEMSEELN